MKLPNAEKAVIDEAKLESYSLSGEHGRGRDKARVFRATMNLGPGDGPALASLLRERIKDDDVDEVENGEYGVLYVLHHPIVGSSPVRRLRHVWILRHGEDFPRLVSCYLVRGR